MKAIQFLVAIIMIGSFATSVNAQCSSKHKKTWSSSTTSYSGSHKGSKDLVTIASETEQLSTLVTAVKAAGLVGTLQGDGPFTIFAPTNEAFAALPKEVLEALLKPENKQKLIEVLTYHVVSGKVTSDKLYDNQSAGTVQGENVKVKIYDTAIKVNDATVIKANINGKNGVVHLIDKVILPPNFKL